MRQAANILGVKIDAVDIKSAADLIERALAEHKKGYVCVTGVHGIMEAQYDSGLRAIINSSLLNVPDGMPTVWVGRLQGCRTIRRVFGPDLMTEICARSAQRGFSHFLYGGDSGVAEQLAACLKQKFPEIRIAGTYTPPFRPLSRAEFEQLQRRIDNRRPDILWVGLSTPKQERFMAELGSHLNTGLLIGVGAAFDFHTGRLRDAPRWMKTLGLQWFHRLLQEPRRLWKRYAINNPKFIWKIALQLTGMKHYG